MMPQQLKETTMDPQTRNLVQVSLFDDNYQNASDSVESLMGKNPELRYKLIVNKIIFQVKN